MVCDIGAIFEGNIAEDCLDRLFNVDLKSTLLNNQCLMIKSRTEFTNDFFSVSLYVDQLQEIWGCFHFHLGKQLNVIFPNSK